ncbi:hypothetical protein [Synoicihabitans lomoniglobus]|uniref:Uncharacterized protein n=1 Tax=Synoicihabitans lomoniglobus TaxID=2909285 RepID=A0AAF0I6Q4_9BACT|nr:hypothetical protein [Opitutaceae bacterium LMO-M01]WED66226.1 hypothetical protein PXH66_05120 [Opitutaceae bacterium LMO-M01]
MPLVRFSKFAIAVTAVLFLAGCGAVPLAQQRLVSKTEMTFERSAAGHPSSNLVSQIEPGLASSGGAQAAGCTSCR